MKKIYFLILIVQIGITISNAQTTTQLIAVDCDAKNISLGQPLTAEPVNGASQYEFLVDDDSTDFSKILTSSDNIFSLNELNTAVQTGTTYRIKVRVTMNGIVSEYGSACEITIAKEKLECGFDAMLRAMSNENADFQQQMEAFNLEVKNYIDNYPGILSVQKTIPVVVHVINKGEAKGTGTNLSYKQIQWQINALNAAFAKDYPAYNQQSHGQYAVNSQIHFCLAQNTFPNTLPWSDNSEPGVMRYSLNPADQAHDHDLATEQALLTGISHPNTIEFPTDKYLNIWLVSKICNSLDNNNCNIIGYAKFPPLSPQTPPLLDGIVFRNDCFGDNTVLGNNFALNSSLDQGKILAHEVGHYLGLYHTFGSSNPNDPAGCYGTNNADCSASGDWCCDTPPSTYDNFDCSNQPNTCNETYFQQPTQDHPDMLENYMSYSNDNCMNTFTSDQAARMNSVLNSNTVRRRLWQPVNLLATLNSSNGICPSCLLTAGFTFSPALPCAGTLVNFVNPAEGNCAISWAWTFGDGGTSNSQNPTHSYINTGTYTVNLIVTGSNGQTDEFFAQIDVIVPSATISTVGFQETSTTVCSGSEASVRINFIGNPPFNVTITNQNINIPVISFNNEIIFPITITGLNPVYSLTNFNDAFCSGTENGSVEFTVVSCCEEMVCNGDFEYDQNCHDNPVDPDCIWSSDHTCSSIPGSGYYIITAATDDINGTHWAGTNHTPNGVFFMICDMLIEPDKNIWEQTIYSLTVGKRYIFSVFLNNIIVKEEDYTDPDMILKINGVQVTPILEISEDPEG